AMFLPRRPLRARLEWKEVASGPRFRIEGRLRTEPAIAPTRLVPVFRAPAPLTADAPALLGAEGPDLTFTLEYTTPYPCLTEFPLPSVRAEDPLGLVRSTVAVTGTCLPIVRYPPELERLGRAHLRRTTSLPGENRSRALGSAGEFFAIRSAADFDTPRQINWPATARAGRLLANDYLLERTGDLILLLDVRPTGLGALRDEQLLSIARAGALGVASGFLAGKARVGLGVFGEFLECVPLGSGRRHRYRVERLLREARGTVEPGPAERLGVSIRRYFPSGVLTLLVSPLASEEQFLLLPHLRRRGFPVVVLSPSSVPLAIPTAPQESTETALARRLLLLERRHILEEVWGEAPVVDWTEYWSLAPLLRLLGRPGTSGRSR
ncbi:MAG: DUF58 domain-containing protein, partial [Thermoplasmata archaeon]